MKRGIETLDVGVATGAGNFEVAQPDHSAAPRPYPIEPNEYQLFASGERSLSELPFHVNELNQIRQDYDPDDMAALAKSLERRDGEPPYIWQINPIQVIEFDNEQDLKEYLNDYQRFYGIDTPIAVDSLERRPDGTWRVLVAGHRRNRAMRIVAEKHGYVLREGDVKIDVYQNMSFTDAIAMQGRENEHVRVKPEDAAEDIKRHYDFYIWQNNGEIPTHVEIAQISGYTPSRVSEALRYSALPHEVKREYTAGLISYEVAIKCHTLWKAFQHYYLTTKPQVYGVQVEGGAELLKKNSLHAVLAEINKLKSERLANVGPKKRMEILQAKINDLGFNSTYITDSFFDDAYDNPELRRRTSGQRVGEYAAQAVLLRMQNGEELSAKEAALLDAITAMRTQQVGKLTESAIVLATESDERDAYYSGQSLF